MDYCTATGDRYARAVASDDLTPYPRTSASPVDVLGAAGMALQRCELGMLLQRLRAGPAPSPVATRVVQAALADRLRLAVRRREARRDGIDSAVVASLVVSWWLDPRCTVCHGVKFQATNGRLLGKHCLECAGSGLRAVPAGDAGRWLVDYISQQVDRSEAVHRAALG